MPEPKVLGLDTTEEVDRTIDNTPNPLHCNISGEENTWFFHSVIQDESELIVGQLQVPL